ncbi:F0F1 ATP synthase subunit delta [Clostridium sulfidigenes]|uniref:F0F1 ATP synthase subunit delta n=1 Tax=Clostridium sulfidigenes TaxID=318464 RepID=UPI003F89919B
MYEFLDRRYALALYEMCKEAGNIETVLQELGEVVEEMDNNEGLIKIIRNPQINKHNKKRIFEELFKGKIEDELLSFLLLLIDKGRILYLREKYNQFRLVYLKNNNTVVAKIKSVIPLNHNERETIKSKLEKRYEKTVIIEEEIDKSLLGGMLISVGDETIDGTIKTKLMDLKNISEGNVGRYNFSELNKELLADIITNKPLNEEEIKKLRGWLMDFYSREIVINNIVDESYKDDIKVIIGEDVTTKATIDEIINSEKCKIGKAKSQECIIDLDEKGKILNATVRTVIPLTDEERIKLTKGLEKFYSRKIVIHEEIDESIVGGVLVKIGNDITDGTVKSKLRYVRDDM